MTINGISLIADQVALVAKVNASITEAPTDGVVYGRRGSDASWQIVGGGGGSGVPEAPLDGALYGRAAAAWVKGVKLAGDVMTGHLTLPAGPASANAVRKDYVDGMFNSIIGSAGVGMDSLGEVEIAFNSLTSVVALKAPLASPALTGTPTAPTAAPGTSTTQVASTAFVASAIGAITGGSYLPVAGGTLTGTLLLAPPAANPSLFLSKPPGAFANVFAGYTVVSGVNRARWSVQLGDNAAESSGDLGSNFSIDSYNDAGTLVRSPISVSRATGNVLMPAALTVNGGVNASNFVAPSTSVILAATGAGTIFLRPNGNAVPGGQTTIDTNGNMNIAAGVTCNGRFQVQTLSDVVIGAANGPIFFRPFGVINATNQLELDAAGVLHAYNYRPKNGVNGGYGTKTGDFNSVDGNYFNIYNSAGFMYFYWNTVNVGYLNISSDYRIKKDIAPLPSMWETLKSLSPIRYTHRKYEMFEDEAIERWGFVAHDLQEKMIESAASGVKDQKNLLQSPNPWTLLAAITRTLQEAMQRIERLEAT